MITEWLNLFHVKPNHLSWSIAGLHDGLMVMMEIKNEASVLFSMFFYSRNFTICDAYFNMDAIIVPLTITIFRVPIIDRVSLPWLTILSRFIDSQLKLSSRIIIWGIELHKPVTRPEYTGNWHNYRYNTIISSYM